MNSPASAASGATTSSSATSGSATSSSATAGSGFPGAYGATPAGGAGERGLGPWGKAGQLLAWSGLIALGARRGGLLGLAAVGYGLDRLSRLTLGTSLSQLLLSATRVEPTRRFGEGTRDLVDEASWESFPASDPPGRGVG